MISRAALSTVVQGQPKYRSMLAGNAAFSPGVFESIATATGDGSSGSITFSSIPSTYKHLQIRGIYNDGGYNLRLRFNSDSGANYSRHTVVATTSAISSGAGINANDLDIICYGGSGANNVSATIIDLLDYSVSGKNKTAKALSGYTESATVQLAFLSSGAWYNTSAITSVTITNLFGAYNTQSVFSLYGIKG